MRTSGRLTHQSADYDSLRAAYIPDRELAQIKRERGESKSSPRWTPVSRLSDGFAVIQLKLVVTVRLSRQNLAASCTTASQDLTAVSGSHSLTETVDLGTMTLGGLVGTLHVVYNSFQNHICSANQLVAATQTY